MGDYRETHSILNFLDWKKYELIKKGANLSIRTVIYEIYKGYGYVLMKSYRLEGEMHGQKLI